MAKNNTTLLLIGGAILAGYILYKKGIIKLPGQAVPGLAVQNNSMPLLPPITQMTIDNPNIAPPVQITAPNITGNSIDLGF